MIVLDTNVWSVLPKPEQDPSVVEWIAERAGDIWLSVIAIAEIRAGIENPKAAAKHAKLTQWLADLEVAYADRTLPFESADAHIFGALVVRKKLEKQETKLLDLQIAAQALARNASVATRNVRDFEWTGVTVIDPWTA